MYSEEMHNEFRRNNKMENVVNRKVEISLP